jgi:hypothetical protein
MTTGSRPTRRRRGGLALFLAAGIALPVWPGAAISAERESLVHAVRFTDYQQGPIDEWLRRKGFQFEQDAKRRSHIDFKVGPNGFIVEAKRRAFGLLADETVNVPEFTHIEIDWGVTKHPQGASYEQGLRNESLMVIIFMGDERQKSGSMFIPDSPYFIGLFLCSGGDRTNRPYVGSYFKKGGRYVCADKPPPGRMVTSRFNLIEGYRAYFDKERDDNPGVSGLALTVDTQKAKGDGTSSAFIREIRFLR